MELQMSFGLIAFDVLGSELTVRLSKDDELFSGIITIGELEEMDADDTGTYFSSLKKKIDYDEETMSLICKRSFGIPGWKCALEKVHLKENDILAAELARAHKRIDELENLLAKQPQPANQGLVKFSYEKGRLSYTFETECDPEQFERYLLCYFKEVVHDYISNLGPKIRQFSRKILLATSFSELQETVFDLCLRVPNGNPTAFRYMPYISDVGPRAYIPYRVDILWEKGINSGTPYVPCRGGNDFTTRYPPLSVQQDPRSPQDGLFSIVKIQFPTEFFAVDAEPPASLSKAAFPLYTFCDIFGNETKETPTHTLSQCRFFYIF